MASHRQLFLLCDMIHIVILLFGRYTHGKVFKTPYLNKECRLDLNQKCLNNKFCKREYSVINLDVIPYSQIPIKPTFTECCGDCFALKESNRTYRSLLEIENVTGYDFVYPILGRYSDVQVNGLYFLPITSHAGYYHITQIQKSSFRLAIDSCLQMYPMLFIFIFLSIVFGFIYWLIEAHNGNPEYPQSFPLGWVKGTWWGMISLVAQGPENIPKSIIGRILAFLWIFIAVILVGIMTSIITAMMVRPYPTPTMNGKKIATLSHRELNKFIIVTNKGEASFVEKNDSWSEIGPVLDLGLRDDYGGVLIDQTLLIVYLSELIVKNRKEFEHLTSRIYLSNVDSPFQETCYGIGTFDKAVYDYYINILRAFVLPNEIDLLGFSNNLQSEAITAIHDQIKKLTQPVIFDIKQPFVQDGFVYFAIIIASFLFIGMIYEAVRRKVRVTRTDA